MSKLHAVVNKENLMLLSPPRPPASLSVESVQAFLLRHNGKVKFTDMMNYFEIPISESRQKAGQNLKDIIQRIAVIKIGREGKYVILSELEDNRPATPLLSNRTKSIAHSISEQLSRSYSNSTNINDNDSISLQPQRKGIRSNCRPTRKNHINANDIMDRTQCEVNESQSFATEFPNISSIKSELESKRLCFLKNSTISLSTDSSISFDEFDDYFYEDTVESKLLQKQLLVAAVHGNSKTVESLISSDPELLNKRDFITGYTALHWGAKLGNTEIIKLIGNKGVDVDMRTKGGQTALHLGAMHGHDDVIRILVDNYGANINVRNYSGKRPKDVIADTLAADVQRRLGRSLILTRDLSGPAPIRELDIKRRQKTKSKKS